MMGMLVDRADFDRMEVLPTFERPFDSLREGLRSAIIKMREEGLVRPDLFIDKPIDPEELVEAVRSLIG